MLTRYLHSSSSSIVLEASTRKTNIIYEDSHQTKDAEGCIKHNTKQQPREQKSLSWSERITVETVPFQSSSPPPSPSWVCSDECSPLIEPIPSKSCLEIEIANETQTEIEFNKKRQEYITQIVKEIFENDEIENDPADPPNNDILPRCARGVHSNKDTASPNDDDLRKYKTLCQQMTTECAELKMRLNDERNKVKQMNTAYFELNMKYSDSLKEVEALRDEKKILCDKRKESERLWMLQVEVLMNDNSELNHTIDIMTEKMNQYEAIIKTQHHSIEKNDKANEGDTGHETEEEDDGETDDESCATNVSMIIHHSDNQIDPSESEDDDQSIISTNCSLSEVFSDIFPVQTALDQRSNETDDDIYECSDFMMGRDHLIELDIENDEKYQLLNECRNVYMNTNQLSSKYVQPLIESSTNCIVSFYEMKHIFVNFITKYEEILERFNSILASQNSLNYHQYDAIYKLLHKNAITARFDSQVVTKIYAKPLTMGSIKRLTSYNSNDTNHDYTGHDPHDSADGLEIDSGL